MAFQVGTQIKPELADADYSGFVNAANIRAQAMMNLGEQIGGAITKYQVNKQKKEEKEVLYKAILPYATQYSSSAEEADSIAKAFSKDPKIGAQILQFAGLEQDTESLNQAIAVNTDTAGNVDYSNVVRSYIELGGKDPNMVAGLVKEAEGGPAKARLLETEQKIKESELRLSQEAEKRRVETEERRSATIARQQELEQRKLELDEDKLEFEIQQLEAGGKTAEAELAKAELEKTRAQTAQIKAEIEGIEKPRRLTPSERMRLIELQIGEFTFGQYLDELMQTKEIEGGKLKQRGLFNANENQIAAFDNLILNNPEFLSGMPQAVKDYYTKLSGSGRKMTLPDGTEVLVNPQQ